MLAFALNVFASIFLGVRKPPEVVDILYGMVFVGSNA